MTDCKEDKLKKYLKKLSLKLKLKQDLTPKEHHIYLIVTSDKITPENKKLYLLEYLEI